MFNKEGKEMLILKNHLEGKESGGRCEAYNRIQADIPR